MNVEIAERLASRRKDAGLSQEALAEKLGVTRQAVSKWERSESSPDTDNLIALAKLYQVSLDELLNYNPAIEDDIAFATADRARDSQTFTTASAAATNETASAAATNETASATASAEGSSPQTSQSNDPEVTVVEDDESYVRINLRDGIHVKDTRKGEEVHVGWNGIRVEGFDKDEQRWNHWWDRWDEKDDDKRYSYSVDENGRRAVHIKRSALARFPFPVIIVIAYFLVCTMAQPVILANNRIVNTWTYGLLLFALIPLYYILVAAIEHRSIVRLIQGLYPVACAATFIWLHLAYGKAHPGWVIFLTIPIVMWACNEYLHWRRRTKNAANTPLEVEPGD